MNRFLAILFIIVLELYSDSVLFGFAPALAMSFPTWFWLSIVFVLLIIPFVAACFLLRRENPLMFLFGVPVTAIVIIILSNIDSQFLVGGLEIYGIYSVFSSEKDIVLTYIPYYVDAFIMALLMIAGRFIFFLPFKLYNELLGDDYGKTDKKAKAVPAPETGEV